MSKPKTLTKYLVISYDEDENQSFFDHVAAENDEQAKRMISNLRDYAIPCVAMDAEELYASAEALENNSFGNIAAELIELSKKK